MGITTVVVAVLSSNVLVKLIEVIAEKFGKSSPTKEAIRAILYERLEWLGTKHIENGFITIRQHATYSSMYKSYKSLNGNTFIDDLYSEVDRLPRK